MRWTKSTGPCCALRRLGWSIQLSISRSTMGRSPDPQHRLTVTSHAGPQITAEAKMSNVTVTGDVEPKGEFHIGWLDDGVREPCHRLARHI